MKQFSGKCVARAATIYWHHQAYTENNRLTLAVLLLSTQHYRQLINCDHDHDYAPRPDGLDLPPRLKYDWHTDHARPSSYDCPQNDGSSWPQFDQRL